MKRRREVSRIYKRGKDGRMDEGEGALVDLARRISPWLWPRWAALLRVTYDRPTSHISSS